MGNLNELCPHSEIVLIEKKETYEVKGEAIAIEAQVPFCVKCNEEIFVPKYDDINLKKAYDIYRKKHNLPSPETIINLRKKYQLSQRSFAILIGCTQSTINRYEQGAIPDPSYTKLIKLMENPENVRAMLEESRDSLDVKDAQKIEENLVVILSEKYCLEDIILSSNAFQPNKPDVYNGFRKCDLRKVISMIVFFAINQNNLYKTKLMKLLWYADMVHFRQYIKSISGMRYVHLPYGPVPEEYELLLGILKAQNYIDIVPDDSFNGEIVSAKNLDNSFLNQNEIEILKRVSDKFLNYTAKEISEVSHAELAYKETNMKDIISYKYAEFINAN